MSEASLTEFLPQQVAEFFQYLDELRESGATNMFGAGTYLQSEFNMDRHDARTVLMAWMDTFSSEPPAARAHIAYTKAD